MPEPHVQLIIKSKTNLNPHCCTSIVHRLKATFDVSGGRTEGEQKLNGQPKGKATLARVMGYVEQDDIHTPALTVYESLRFSAHLRLNRDVNTRSEKAFVDDVRS